MVATAGAFAFWLFVGISQLTGNDFVAPYVQGFQTEQECKQFIEKVKTSQVIDAQGACVLVTVKPIKQPTGGN